ncbi:MAG: DUF2628 domain-containing protein [Oscillospiraceae bacterium]|jgi:hypothetical protein|nr:DUF2628 domain-containing protein [Oscillospiraceae bacterium]
MRYENEACCGCGQPFAADGEAVVVCPDCGAPLHRACWDARGVCPFAAEHGSFVWQPTAQGESAQAAPPVRGTGAVCPVCGEHCPQNAVRCPVCQAALAPQEESVPGGRPTAPQAPFPPFRVEGKLLAATDTIGGETVEALALRVRGSFRGVLHYLRRFAQNRVFSWNWAAFVFGPFWFFFRKLYKPGLAFAGLLLAAAFALSPLETRYLRAAREMAPPLAAQYSDAVQKKDETGSLAALTALATGIKALAAQHKAFLILDAATILCSHLFAGLLGDFFLRRKVWADLARFRDIPENEEPEQAFFRQRRLVRQSGFSIFAPVAYFWASQYLPGLLVGFFEWITG